MTQLITARPFLDVVRRRPPSGIYRVAQAQVATSFASKRVLGMWVPAEAFRRGTIIRFTGQSSTNSAIFKLGIGGPATAISLGVQLTFTTGPAAPVGFDLRATQRTEGFIPTFDSSGFFSGATSLVVSTGTFTPFIQPLNYVEIVTSGTFTIVGGILEVIPPQWNSRAREEMFDV